MEAPSTYKAIASGAGNVQGHTGGTKLTGFAVSAAAAATVTLHDGTDATGPIVAIIALGAAGGDSRTLPKVQISVGIFVERSAAAAVTLFLTS